MAAGKSFNLSLVITAIDHVTAPLNRLNQRISTLTAPLTRVGNAMKSMSEAAGVPKLIDGFRGVGSALGRVGSEVGRLASRFALLGLGAAVAFGSIVSRAVEMGDTLAKLADRLRLPIDVVAELRFVAGRAGVDEHTFDTALEQFNKRLGQAKLGSGPLEALGDVAPNLLGQLKGAQGNAAALDVMFNALKRVKDANVAAALATAAFGKSGSLMVNMVAEDIEGLRAEYRRLAGSQEQFARLSEALDDQLGDLGTAFLGVKVAVMTSLFPALTQLAKQLTEVFVNNRDLIAGWAAHVGTAIGEFAESLPERITGLIEKFEEWKKRLQPIADAVGGWPTLLAAVGAAIVSGPLIGALASLAAAFIALGIAIGMTPIGWFLGAVALLAGAAALLTGQWEPIGEFFTSLWDGVKQTFMGFLEFLRGLFTLDIGRMLGGLGDLIGGSFKTAWRALNGLGTGIGWAAKGIAGFLTTSPENDQPGASTPVRVARPGLPASQAAGEGRADGVALPTSGAAPFSLMPMPTVKVGAVPRLPTLTLTPALPTPATIPASAMAAHTTGASGDLKAVILEAVRAAVTATREATRVEIEVKGDVERATVVKTGAARVDLDWSRSILRGPAMVGH